MKITLASFLLDVFLRNALNPKTDGKNTDEGQAPEESEPNHVKGSEEMLINSIAVIDESQYPELIELLHKYETLQDIIQIKEIIIKSKDILVIEFRKCFDPDQVKILNGVLKKFVGISLLLLFYEYSIIFLKKTITTQV